MCCDCCVLGWFRLLPFSLPFWPCSGPLQLLLPPCLPHLSPVHPHSGPRWRQNGSWEEDFAFLFGAAQSSWDSMLTQLSCCISSPACHTRLHRELPVAEDNEDPQDSLDDCYLTSSFGHDPPDTCRPYTSASFTFDKQETFLGLDVGGKYSHCEGHNTPGWRGGQEACLLYILQRKSAETCILANRPWRLKLVRTLLLDFISKTLGYLGGSVG